ncbi:retrovirus-related pol polyprotein from transposon TNT 1-94 [Tanacetum coccineum]
MPVHHKAGRIIKEAGDHDPAIGTNHEYEDSIWNYATAFEKEMKNLSSKKMNIDDTVSIGLKSYVNVVTASKLKPKLNFRPVAFPLVQNYVTNTWAKFGFKKVIKDEDDVFYFKFSSITGLEQVLEQGPWLVRNQPLILTKWAPNLDLAKDVVTKVPVWVKIHKVPVVAYSNDGLSLIASQIGKPAEKELKQEVKMVVLKIVGEGQTIE